MFQCVVKSPDTKGRMITRVTWTYGTRVQADRQKRDIEALGLEDGTKVSVRPL